MFTQSKLLYLQKLDNFITVGTENGFFPVLFCRAFSPCVGTGVATCTLGFRLRGNWLGDTLSLESVWYFFMWFAIASAWCYIIPSSLKVKLTLTNNPTDHFSGPHDIMKWRYPDERIRAHLTWRCSRVPSTQHWRDMRRVCMKPVMNYMEPKANGG